MTDLDRLRNRGIESALESVYRRGLDWKMMLVGIVILIFCQFLMLPSAESEEGVMPRNARVVLLIGFFVVTVSAFFFAARVRGHEWTPRFSNRIKLNLGAHRWAIFGIGIAALGFLTLRLLGGSESGSDLWIWAVGIGGLAVPFAPSSTRILVGLRRAYRSIRTRDLVIVGALVVAFTTLNLSDLTDWYYAAIGDEYAVWEITENFARNGISKPFGQDGVYDHHPRLGFALKSAVMKIVGIDYFGWKSSSVFLVALTIPGVYWLGTLLRDRVTGFVAATIFASSHYVFALAHAGINSVDSFLPVVYGMSFFVLSTRTKSPLLLFVTGILVGACFYFNYSARIILPIVGIFWAVQTWPRFPLRSCLPFVIGVGATILPLVIVNGSDVITSMFTVTIGGQPEAIDKGLIERMVDNVLLNLYAFNFNERSSHYISGSLMDSVSVVIAVTGVAFAMGRIGHAASRLLLLWLLIGFIATGLVSPYWHTAVTRLYPLLIPLALSAGIFVSAFVWPINIRYSGFSTGGNLLHPKMAAILAILVIALSVWILNVQRFNRETPEVFHVHPIPVTIGAIESSHCNHLTADRIAVAGEDLHLLRLIFHSYAPASTALLPGQQPENPDAPQFLDGPQLGVRDRMATRGFGCIIFAQPWQPDQARILNELRSEHPGSTVVPFSDRSGKTTISILKLP